MSKVRIKAINDFVFILPIEDKHEGSIELLKNDRTYRKGYIESISSSDGGYAVGDKVVYSDTAKEIDMDDGTPVLHLVKESAIYFKEI